MALRISPAVMAALAAQAPARIVRKLDDKPDTARAWTWTESDDATIVVTDSGETVTARGAGVLADVSAIGCTCLLSPKCLHVLAVARALPLGDVEPEVTAAPAVEVERPWLDADQRAAAAALFRAAASVLDAGADATGSVREVELLRAIHACRATGLHRGASAGLRVVRAIRDLRAHRPEASLAELTSELKETLACATALDRDGEIDAAWIGTARRAYRTVGNLRLYGLFSEAIIAASGYAGVVTYLVDAKSNIYSVSDVLPGEPTRAPAAYEGPAEIGDARLAHRELSREGLFLSEATASADGRLGSGAAVRAVRAGPSSWLDDGPAKLWSVSLEAQLDRVARESALALTSRTAGWDLLFLRARILGATRDALIVELEPESGVIRCVPASDHAVLRYRDGLRRLAQVPGLRLLAIGRVRPAEHRTIELLAVGAPGDASEPPRWRLPEAWRGRANVGLDAIEGAFIEGDSAPLLLGEGGELAPSDPLDALRRRVQRTALGGRSTLPPEAARAIASEATTFERRMMPTAALVLRELASAAGQSERSTAGARRRADPAVLARAWLRAASYVDVAQLALQRERWW